MEINLDFWASPFLVFTYHAFIHMYVSYPIAKDCWVTGNSTDIHVINWLAC
jgi:hypothetical protein